MDNISNFEYGEQNHTPYLVRIKRYFENKGAKVIYAGGEHTIPKSLLDEIKFYKHDITAYHIRNHGDMFITFDDGHSYYIECKVMTPDKYNPKIARENTMLEASALANHFHNAKIGIKTIYCILDPCTNKQYGIVLDEFTYRNFHFKDDEVWWFKQSHGTFKQGILKWQLSTVFYPRILQHFNYNEYGESDDPMVLVKNSELLPLKEIMVEIMESIKK